MRTLVCSFLIFMGFLAPAANAGPFTPEDEQLYAEALIYWNASPTRCTSITTGHVATDPTQAPDTAGVATPVKPYYFGPCILELIGYYETCLEREIMYHEVGHLLGYEHSPDPASIMYPQTLGRFCIIPPEPITHPKRKKHKHKQFHRNEDIPHGIRSRAG